jgi:hypothetical protein
MGQYEECTFLYIAVMEQTSHRRFKISIYANGSKMPKSQPMWVTLLHPVER